MILGIDPGIAIVGFGIIKEINQKLIPVDYGVIRTKAKTPLANRLEIIHLELTKLFQKYPITEVAVEDLYFARNAKTAMIVGHARGVIIVTARLNNAEVFEYTPNQIKVAITGYGAAQKPQVQSMVQKLLNLKDIPKPDDTADALACAICHYNSRGLLKKIQEYR